MIEKLIEAIDRKDNPTVVGLDPLLDRIPDAVKQRAFSEFGQTLEGAAKALLWYNQEIVEAVADLVPAVKVQAAMYERFGAPGMQAFADTIAFARTKGLLVIGDVKRGDIASTAAAYADGHLGEVTVGSSTMPVFDEDMITLNPYMGADSVTPYFNWMRQRSKGLFLLVKTSNPGSGDLQDLLVQERDGSMVPLYEHAGRLADAWGEPFRTACGYSDIGAVVGATYPQQGTRLRQLFPHMFFLVPGYGAQGATAQDVSGCFDSEGRGALVNSSRGILFAYQVKKYSSLYGPGEYGQAARKAVIDMRDDLNRVRKKKNP